MRLVMLLVTFLLLSPVRAQDGYPLPETLTPITVENAAQMEELARIGGALPGGLAWSPDGRRLAAGTTEGVWVYDASDFSTPIHIPDGDQNVLFINDRRLLSAGKLWDVETGEFAFPASSPPSFLWTSPTGQLEAFAAVGSGETFLTIHISQADTHLSLADLRVEIANIHFRNLVFSPDDSMIALVLNRPDPEYPEYVQPIVQLWDIATSRLIATLEHYQGVLNPVDFSRDGDVLLTASIYQDEYGQSLGDVTLWNSHTGERIDSWFTQPRLIHSPTDSSIIAFVAEGGVLLWDGDEITPLDGEYGCESDEADDLIFSPDGNTLAVTLYCGEQIFLWDVYSVARTAEPRAVLTGEAGFSRALFTADGTQLITGEQGRVARLWDVQNGEQLTAIENVGWVENVSPQGDILLSRDSDQQYHLWNIATGEEQLALPWNARLNTDWSQAAYWHEGTVIVINLATEMQTVLRVIDNYLGYAIALNSAKGQAIFSYENPRFYDLHTGQHIFTWDTRSTPVFSPDGARFVTESGSQDNDRILEVREFSSPDTPVATIEISSCCGDPQFSPDGTLLAVLERPPGYGPGHEQLWDITSNSLVANWRTDIAGNHAFSADGTLLATGAEDRVILWDVAATMAYAPDGQGEDSEGVVLRSLVDFSDSQVEVQEIAFSPDNEWLAVALLSYPREAPPENGDYIIYLWSLPQILQYDGEIGLQQDEFIHIPLVNMRSPIFSPDSQMLATHNTAGVSLWNVDAIVNGADTPMTVLPADNPNIQEIAFNPDGTLLFVRDTSGVSVWGVP